MVEVSTPGDKLGQPGDFPSLSKDSARKRIQYVSYILTKDTCDTRISQKQKQKNVMFYSYLAQAVILKSI